MIKRGDRFVDPTDGVSVTVVGAGDQRASSAARWWRVRRDGDAYDTDVAEHYLRSWQRLPDQPPLSAEERRLIEEPHAEPPPGPVRITTATVPRGAFEAACGLVRRALSEREPSLRAAIAADLEALERDNKRA